ncbi:YdhK family protein [Bacillus sp. V5-8f]|uniref:YdhK family protein n=1 Tax=Bacillus sp. V5-8f TaxID=2053044 RepID=UPI000C75CD7C|nr:YdhK family protein [Bacillus sp. V5-8f]PLT32858.1 hypothetical protein CUU64_17145 [Bacillus sp. V5-8f]
MKGKKITLVLISLIMALFLAACGNGGNDKQESNNYENGSHGNMKDENMDHSEMNHSGSGEVPEGLKEAENPTYQVGSKAILETDHMEGMKGAEAEIVGAYDTTVYAVSYTPTTGGERVKNHKWVIHEELMDASDTPFKPGDEVTLEAGHMEGMKGAKATIKTAQQMTIYMVDYISTIDGKEVENHQWVTEDEIYPLEGDDLGHTGH